MDKSEYGDCFAFINECFDLVFPLSILIAHSIIPDECDY